MMGLVALNICYMMGLVALIASSEQQLKSAAASGARLHSAGFATEMHVKHIDARHNARKTYTRCFFTVPPNFQYQRDARKTYRCTS